MLNINAGINDFSAKPSDISNINSNNRLENRPSDFEASSSNTNNSTNKDSFESKLNEKVSSEEKPANKEVSETKDKNTNKTEDSSKSSNENNKLDNNTKDGKVAKKLAKKDLDDDKDIKNSNDSLAKDTNIGSNQTKQVAMVNASSDKAIALNTHDVKIKHNLLDKKVDDKASKKGLVDSDEKSDVTKKLAGSKDVKDEKFLDIKTGDPNLASLSNLAKDEKPILDTKSNKYDALESIKDKKANANSKEANIQDLVMVTDKRTDVQKLEASSSPTINIAEQMANLKQTLKAEGNAQIVEKAHIILNSADSGQIKLTLKPENLGTVQIDINLEDQKVLGRIIVDNNAVKNVFDENMSDLRDSMLKSGFNSSELNVSVGQRDSADGREQFNHNKNNGINKPNAKANGSLGNIFDENNVPLVGQNVASSFRTLDVTA